MSRPIGRALVVGTAPSRAQPVETLRRLYSFECAESEDPYSAVLELCRHKGVYNAVILSLASLYREELGVIATIKRRFPHLEIWLTHTDGRQAALAEAMRLGADGLLGEDGLHRIAPTQPAPEAAAASAAPPLQLVEEPEPRSAEARSGMSAADETPIGEPVLSTDELRALLQDQPSMPPSSSAEQSHG